MIKNNLNNMNNNKNQNPFFNEPSGDIPLDPEHGGPILCMD